jgi:hypothetical protein
MTPQEEKQAVLSHLAELTHADGVYCTSFAPIVRSTGLTRERVRFLCRLLKRQGLAQFHSGLWNEDGEPAGAGYCISPKGLELYDGVDL